MEIVSFKEKLEKCFDKSLIYLFYDFLNKNIIFERLFENLHTSNFLLIKKV